MAAIEDAPDKLWTVDEFLTIAPHAPERHFVVSVERRDMIKALDAFASIGELLPGVAADELVEKFRRKARQHNDEWNARGSDENSARKMIARLEKRAKKVFADHRAEQCDEWSMKYTLIQADLIPRLSEGSGPATTGDLFAVHPVVPDRYLRVDRFQPTLFMERFSEVVRLVQSLGPKSMEITMAKSDYLSAKVGLKGRFPGPSQVDVDAGVSAEGWRENKGTMSGKYQYDRQEEAPSVPDDLHYVAALPEFRSVVEGRLKHKQTVSEVTFEFASDYGVDQSLVAAVKELGLNQNGKFSAVHEQTLRLVVTWWPTSGSTTT